MSDIHFVGGEKGGVGKSVFARILTQYFIDQGKPLTALDADASHGALTRFYADYSRAISLGNVDDTDQIVQLAVDTNQTLLVDLPSQSRKALDSWLNENQILPMIQACHVDVVFWHVMDDSVDALKLLEQTMATASDLATYVIVKNYGRGEDFTPFEGSEIERNALSHGAKIISIKQLQSATMRKIDRLNFSFWAAMHNSNTGSAGCLSLMERQRVKTWLNHAYQQIELALNASHSSLDRVSYVESTRGNRPYLASV